MKNAVALAVAAVLGATTAIGTRELLLERKDVTYRAHQIDVRRAQVDDGTLPTAMSYVTAFVPTGLDGGVRLSDLGGRTCPLDTKQVQDCAKVLLDHGSSEACR